MIVVAVSVVERSDLHSTAVWAQTWAARGGLPDGQLLPPRKGRKNANLMAQSLQDFGSLEGKNFGSCSVVGQELMNGHTSGSRSLRAGWEMEKKYLYE